MTAANRMVVAGNRSAILAFDIDVRCGEVRTISCIKNRGLTIVGHLHRTATMMTTNAVILHIVRFEDRMLARAVDRKMPRIGTLMCMTFMHMVSVAARRMMGVAARLMMGVGYRHASS